MAFLELVDQSLASLFLARSFLDGLAKEREDGSSFRLAHGGHSLFSHRSFNSQQHSLLNALVIRHDLLLCLDAHRQSRLGAERNQAGDVRIEQPALKLVVFCHSAKFDIECNHQLYGLPEALLLIVGIQLKTNIA